MKDPHPSNWTCPSCKKKHDKPHWKDHHQKEPGWEDKLDEYWEGKESNPDFEVVCETCGHELIENLNQTVGDIECPDGHGVKVGSFCNECGEELIPKEAEQNWCPECKAERQGIPAPMFCPSCAWEEPRLILLRV